MSPELKDKLLKLAALASGGVGGERDNAEAILDRLLASHGLTRSALEDPDAATTRIWFKYKMQWQAELLHQIVYAVTDRRSGDTIWTSRARKQQVGYDLTKAETAEVTLKYEVYCKALAAEQTVLYSAFIAKHRIYAASPPPKDAEFPETCPEELARIRAMMTGMADVAVHKRIGGA